MKQMQIVLNRKVEILQIIILKLIQKVVARVNQKVVVQANQKNKSVKSNSGSKSKSKEKIKSRSKSNSSASSKETFEESVIKSYLINFLKIVIAQNKIKNIENLLTLNPNNINEDDSFSLQRIFDFSLWKQK